MRFQIPQYINVEDKVIFGMTFKQFGFVVIPVVVYILLFMQRVSTLKIVLVEMIVLPYCLLSAFYKVNGQKFNTVFFNFLKYLIKSRFYIWRKIPRVKFFPEIDISLFHKIKKQGLDQKEIEKKIKELSETFEKENP